jgi:hypothetical protein
MGKIKWIRKVAMSIVLLVGVVTIHLQAQAYSGFWVKEDADMRWASGTS